MRVLTNSLAANDVALVYGGYSQWRKPLLEGGVELWELKPSRQRGRRPACSARRARACTPRRSRWTADASFVGSYNLDPRSTSLNCEQGVFVDSPVIAAQLEEIFRDDSSGDRAWAVTLQDGELHWTDGTTDLRQPPEASAGRRFQAWIARVLPLSSQL